jgi:transposase
MRRAAVIELTDEGRAVLVKWSKGRRVAARLVERANIILQAAAGTLSKDIAAELEIPPKTVCKWRCRFAQQRLPGIEQYAPRGGRKPSVRNQLEAEIIRRTTQDKPAKGQVWSTRKMAQAVGTSQATVNRVWRDNGLKPHLSKTFKVSNDPRFPEKLVDIVGLYLNPPENAVVFSVDEKTRIQALDRTQKSLPMFPGRLKTLTHDYKRNGTTTLFARSRWLKARSSHSASRSIVSRSG